MRSGLLVLAVLSAGLLANDEEQSPVPMWGLPDVVTAIEALNEKIKGDRWCVKNECRRRWKGHFLFLDLYGPPAWRRVESFYSFHGNPRNENYSDVYLDLNGRGGQRDRLWWYPKLGLMFAAEQLPDIAPGELTDSHIAGDETPFLFNDTRYQLRFDKRCHESSSDGQTRFYANMDIVLLSDGIEQVLSTSIHTNDPGYAYASCDEAKNALPKSVHFEFSGDLDGDGKLDLVFMKNAGGFLPTAYMSRYAEPGSLLKAFSIDNSC